jgi:hypothetical protein
MAESHDLAAQNRTAAPVRRSKACRQQNLRATFKGGFSVALNMTADHGSCSLDSDVTDTRYVVMLLSTSLENKVVSEQSVL